MYNIYIQREAGPEQGSVVEREREKCLIYLNYVISISFLQIRKFY